MATALIHIAPRQKRLIARRARLRHTSFSREIGEAIKLYLSLPVGSERELSVLAHAANRSAARTIKKVDKTIAYVDRVLGRRKNSTLPNQSNG